MSWATRRRLIYFFAVFVFLALVISVPLYLIFHQPASCFDGVQNQKETSPDHGGPCVLLDGSSITPYAILWARSFKLREGAYDSVAYIENPNDGAGVESVGYRFGLYDSENVLIAEKTGTTFIMPGGVTPVFEGFITSGNREAARTRFQFTTPLRWMRMQNVAHVILVNNKEVTDTATMPRLSANVLNTSVADMTNLSFIAVIFDPAGNAFASSATALTRLNAGETQQIVFTWPSPFTIAIGRIDIIPLHAPKVAPAP